MEYVETNVIVLEIKPYKEHDALVKVLTEDYGIQTLFIKRGMSPKYQYFTAIQPLTLGRFSLKLNPQGLAYLQTVKETQMLKQIQLDIIKKAYAINLGNIVIAALEQNERDMAVYSLLYDALQLIEQDFDCEVVSFIFEVQMLKRFGVMPNFGHCAICGENSDQIPYDYSWEYGGIICERHFSDITTRYHAHPRALYYVRKFLQIDLQELKSINLSVETKQLIRKFIDQLYNDYVGIKLKSRKFIDEMSQLEQILKED